MCTHNICLYNEVGKKYTGCNLKTRELLDCALIGVCDIIRLNMVISFIFEQFFSNFTKDSLINKPPHIVELP